MSGRWLRQLIHVGLEQRSLRGLGSLAEVIALATGASGVVLWEEAQPDEANEPSVMAAWLDDGVFGHNGFKPRPDPATLAAFRVRTLALSDDRTHRLMVSSGSDRTVLAAVPVDWVEGGRGVLTLLGEGQLTGEAFDTLADLIDVLPTVCNTVKKRHALALVNTCNEILRTADVAPASEPLEYEQLSLSLRKICETIAEEFQFVNVSIFLKQQNETSSAYALFASSGSGRPTTRVADGPVGSVGAAGVVSEAPGAGPGRGTSPEPGEHGPIVVPVSSGGYLWGRIECTGTFSPPFHFTDSELSLLTPVAAQIGLYWSHWLHRREISNENRSWRSLASGVTELNEQIRDQLGRRRPNSEPVYHAAFRVVHEVVRECTAVEVEEYGESDSRTVTSPDRAGLPLAEGDRMSASVRRTGTRHSVPDGGAASRQSATADAGGWVVATPIRVSGAVYGVLNAVVQPGALPLNSKQVCQIIADQLGLYHFLKETLKNLRDAQRALEHTLASQAKALEDIQHQLVSPLVAATVKIEGVLRSGRFDSRTDVHLRAVRGLCRRAGRVALSAGVFSMLSKGQLPDPKSELLGFDELLRLVILSADDAQVLVDPRRKIRIDVERNSFRSVGSRLVLADRSFLEQCMGNVIDNAAKYSYEGTTVEIGGTAAQTSLMICVSSHGIPIQPGDIERCLKRNWRGRAARTATGEGSGLGLWIVDNLTRSMKGAVEIAVNGDATVVNLRLPYA